jgi:hypothetical protein
VRQDLGETGFKEWAIVCNSIALGETSLLIRKGGIAEGRDGFRFKHERFFLFPTYFHEQILQTRLGADRESLPESGEQNELVTVSLFAEVEFTAWIDDLRQMEPLRFLHVLRDSVIEQRFLYDERQGLNIAFLRAFKLEVPWVFPAQKSYGGCRSWVTLPERPADLRLHAVLSETEQTARRELLKSLHGSNISRAF